MLACTRSQKAMYSYGKLIFKLSQSEWLNALNAKKEWMRLKPDA
jgi:hypothetical protein